MQAAFLVLLPHFVAVMAQTFTTQTIAQWEVGGIDYMWDAEHTKASYIKDGQFILNNNYVAGVKVYGDQVFVTVPRWFSGVPSTLNYFKFVKGAGEFFTMKNPTLIPFPSWEGNALSAGGSSSGSSSHTSCNGLQYVQSMEIDRTGTMWIIDVGSINIFDSTRVNHCPPKIVLLNVGSGEQVDEPYIFSNSVASHTTNFLNDIVIDNDRQMAYISDTSNNGGIIVYDRNKRRAQRFDHAKSMGPDLTADINWTIAGIHYPQGSAGFQGTPEDAIAITPDGTRIYYGALAGLHLYSLDALILSSFENDEENASWSKRVAATILDHGLKNGPSDGITFTCDNELVFGGLTTASVYSWDALPSSKNTQSPVVDTSQLVANDEINMNWVDTFAWDDNGELWYTANHLNIAFTTVPRKSSAISIFKTSGFAGSYQWSTGCDKRPPAPPRGGAVSSPSKECKLYLVLMCFGFGLFAMVTCWAVGQWVYSRQQNDEHRRQSNVELNGEGLEQTFL